MGRSPFCDANGLKRGPWTPEEDQKLFAYIKKHGHGSWRSLPEKAGLQRCGKSCRLRWINYLRPDIKRGKFSLQEQKTIIQLHAFLGNRWSAIASHLPNRTDNEIKNYWNTHIKKRLTMMGIDPATHKPMAAALGSANGDPKKVSHLTHMAQWESARLEAEARLVKESTKLRQNDPQQQPAGFPKPAFPTQRLKRIDFSKLAGAPRCLDIVKAWQRVQLKAIVIENNSTNDLDSEASAALNFLHNGRASSVNSNNNIASNFPSHYEGLMATCQDMDFDHDHDHPGDQAWNMGACNVGDHEDLDWIKGFSNLLFSDCEGDHLVQSNLDDYGNNGSNHDDENNNYWDDMFNLIDSGSGL